MATALDGRTKRALVIGIDKFDKLAPRYQLSGCVNDAKLMYRVLCDHFGFLPEHIETLHDEQATRDAILAAMDRLIDATGKDDVVVIHYSGHGSQMTDREEDEADGLDETIMPHDSGRDPEPNRDITDDEIYLKLLRLTEKTSNVTLIFDCCHSGTITRDAFGGKARGVEPDRRPIEQLPPSPVGGSMSRSVPRDEGPSGWLPMDGRYVLIAGCRDDERSYEHAVGEGETRVVHGALTFYFCQELRKLLPNATYQDAFEPARAQVTAGNPYQHPQIEGALDREVFGVRDIVPMRFVGVAGRAGGTVTLAAGAAHGMTTGSEWSVYPHGTKTTERSTPIGVVKITGVGAISSEAIIVQEARPDAIVESARAVEKTHAFSLEIGVQLVPGAGVGAATELAAMKQEINDSRLLRLVNDEASAAVRLYLLGSRTTVSETDPVPQLGPLDQTTWVAVANGEQIAPLEKLGGVTRLRENLEIWARYRHVLALENPDAASGLRGKVRLELLRRGPDGEWVRADPEQAGGQIVFEEGDEVAINVFNDGDESVYVYLFDFGLSGRVKMVYPRGPGEALSPGKAPFRLPREKGWSLGFPQNFRPAASAGGDSLKSGLETFKLFVTRRQANFGFLEQEGMRAPPPDSRSAERRAAPTMLEELMRASYSGERTRDVFETAVAPEEDWTTVQHSFVLQEKTPSKDLVPDGRDLPLGNITLRTRGFRGRAKLYPWGSARARAAQLATDRLERALASANISEASTIEIAAGEEVGPAARSTSVGEPALELDVPVPGAGRGQLLLCQDESGVASWQFAREERQRIATRGERGVEVGVQTYVIRRRVIQNGRPVARGLLGAVGKKFLKVLVFPLLEPEIGEVADFFAARWERAKRPYRLRSFTPDDYQGAQAAELDAEALRRLGDGRALLLVHGTFSRAHSAFGSLPREFVEQLHQRYGRRVFAFDHFTLSEDPAQNVEWFLQRLPSDSNLDLDILCHSRGGLVSRMLVERQGQFSLGSRKLRIGKVVFAGTPNAGTALADPIHMEDLVDGYTNLLSFLDILPDVGVIDVLDAIITVVKQLAVGALKGLEGLQSMSPRGKFARGLNSGVRAGDTRYFALASNFVPESPGLKEFAIDHFADRIFRVKNDLVVPTEGVFQSNGSGFFPIEDRHVFEGPRIGHTAYFADQEARGRILQWLGG